MPAITISTSNDYLIKTPWMAFVNVPIPALASGNPPIIPLAADSVSGWKTPDISGTPSPTPFWLGCTKEGWTTSSEGETTNSYFCDEFDDALFTDTSGGSTKLEADLLSTRDPVLLTQLFGMTTIGTPPSGQRHQKSPSSFSGTEVTLMLVGRKLVSGTYKYQYIYYPSVKQTAKFGTGNRKKGEIFSMKASFAVQLYTPWGTSFTEWNE